MISSGCSRTAPSVDGKVLLDGQRVESGSIKFVPMDPQLGPDAGATIEDGQYKIDKGLRVGEYRVEIRSPKPTRKTFIDPVSNVQVPMQEEAVLPEYNEKSRLRKKVEAGANIFDFEVEGKKTLK
jgi:hypothetical protein